MQVNIILNNGKILRKMGQSNGSISVNLAKGTRSHKLIRFSRKEESPASLDPRKFTKKLLINWHQKRKKDLETSPRWREPSNFKYGRIPAMLSSEAELLAHRNVTSIYTPWRILYTLIVFNEKTIYLILKILNHKE